MISVEHLFISPGHNFYGRQGQTPGSHPLLRVQKIDCVAGRGIKGDRFFDYKPDYKGQITFFAAEVFDLICTELNLEGADPAALRRNVITRGPDLNQLIGTEFTLQGLQFLGIEECRPCSWMNIALRHPGAEQWLRGRGGLRAKILTDGPLQRDRS